MVKIDDQLIGVLMMVKNEEESIVVSLESTKNYFKHILIFDTGSTDNTIKNIKEVTSKNNQILHLKEGTFKSFPESRNEAIEFAESIKVKFLLMMDAGDEFQTNKNKTEFLKAISSLPTYVNHGLVKQKWFENNKGNIETNDHNDLRFIRNNVNCRYDLDIPVHEAFLNVGQYANLFDIFILYQNRVKYGGSTEKRYAKDVELLSKAKPTKRNLYFLAQSYMSLDDFKNGFIYNVKSYETREPNHAAIDEKFTLVRIAYCAMMSHMSLDIILKYLEMAVTVDKPPVDGFVYYMKVCIDNRCVEKVVPYIKQIYDLVVPTDESTLVNHNFYAYTRYNLLSIVCLLAGKHLDIGYNALKKAIQVKSPNPAPDDLHNLKIYFQIFKENGGKFPEN
jgi:glycosyltransferase involved in cell wall biosynthesis